MTRPVSEHDQPHIRSPFMTAAPTSSLRRAMLRKIPSLKRRFRPWLVSVRPPGSARTDRVLEDVFALDAIDVQDSLGGQHFALAAEPALILLLAKQFSNVR